MGKLTAFFGRLFPSNVHEGEIGSVKLNIWLAQITGVPIIGLKKESCALKAFILIYGILASSLITFIYTGFEMYDLAMNYHDLDSLTQNTCLSLTHITGALKTINIMYRLPEIRQVLEKLRYVTKTYIKSEKQMEVFLEGEVENKFVLSIYMAIVGFTGLLGAVMLYMMGMVKLKVFFEKLFPSNVEEGEIGSVKLNIWLAQITGVPIIGLKEETSGLRILILMYCFVITTAVTFFYTGFEMCDLAWNTHDLDDLTQNTALSFTHFLGALKTINIIYRLPKLRKVVKNLTYATKTYIKSEKQLEVFYNGEVENKLVLSIYISIVGFTACLGVVILYIYPEAAAGKIFPYRVILPSWMPQQVQLAYMALSVMIFAIQIIAVDYFNVTIINQIRFQLNVLNLAFDDLIVDTQPNASQQTQSLMIYKQDPVERLTTIVEHHTLLRELRQDTEDIFSQPILWQFFTSVIIFAMTGFQATVRTGGSSAAVLIYAYCGCIFCELFVYCWFGNEVFEQSKTLATSGFNSSWYLFDRRYGKSLLIFLTNAQRPFIFTAGGFMGLSLPSFAGILSKSYSYIALLRQIYGK